MTRWTFHRLSPTEGVPSQKALRPELGIDMEKNADIFSFYNIVITVWKNGRAKLLYHLRQGKIWRTFWEVFCLYGSIKKEFYPNCAHQEQIFPNSSKRNQK